MSVIIRSLSESSALNKYAPFERDTVKAEIIKRKEPFSIDLTKIFCKATGEKMEIIRRDRVIRGLDLYAVIALDRESRVNFFEAFEFLKLFFSVRKEEIERDYPETIHCYQYNSQRRKFEFFFEKDAFTSLFYKCIIALSHEDSLTPVNRAWYHHIVATYYYYGRDIEKDEAEARYHADKFFEAPEEIICSVSEEASKKGAVPPILQPPSYHDADSPPPPYEEVRDSH